ncbi:UvrD-helicase domain-containing protein [Lampropedia puyangensis]|nr:ATP-dependent helicase [Lampropedia puyangensis]
MAIESTTSTSARHSHALKRNRAMRKRVNRHAESFHDKRFAMDCTEKEVDAIVCSPHKHVEVMAVAGSGKTHTLMMRILYLIVNKVDPEKILLLGFTNASVDNLNDRIREWCDAPLAEHTQRALERNGLSLNAQIRKGLIRVQAKTVHGFALNLLRPQGCKGIATHAERHPLFKHAVDSVLRRLESKTVWPRMGASLRQTVRNHLTELGKLGANKTEAIYEMDATELAQLWLPGVDHGERIVAKVVEAFNTLCTTDGKFTYDELLIGASEYLKKHRTAHDVTHVLVDEYQDCDSAQRNVIRNLGLFAGCSVMAVGDPDQAIFGFSGGGYKPLKNLLKGSVNYPLSVSFRLTKPMADLANAVRKSDASIQALRGGSKPKTLRFPSEQSQANFAASWAERLLNQEVPKNQVAVIGRTHASLKMLRRALLKKGLLGFDLKTLVALKKVLHACEMISRPTSTNSWMPNWLGTLANDHQKKQLRNAAKAHCMMSRFRILRQLYWRTQCAMNDAEKTILKDLELVEPLLNAFETPLQAWCHFKSFDGGVSVMTVHAAKGKEWDHVMVIGAVDGLMPIQYAIDQKRLKEERNVMYVAVTRARVNLTILWCPMTHVGRFAKQSVELNQISRFLR